MPVTSWVVYLPSAFNATFSIPIPTQIQALSATHVRIKSYASWTSGSTTPNPTIGIQEIFTNLPVEETYASDLIQGLIRSLSFLISINTAPSGVAHGNGLVPTPWKTLYNALPNDLDLRFALPPTYSNQNPVSVNSMIQFEFLHDAGQLVLSE